MSRPAHLTANGTGAVRFVPEGQVSQGSLATLGAQRLARILTEQSARSSQLRRRLQTELAAQSGVGTLAEDIRGRLEAVLQPAGSPEIRIDARQLAYDLECEREAIVDTLASRAPKHAFDLLLRFLELHARVMERVDDSEGRVAHVFYKSCCDLGPVAEAAQVYSSRLAGTIVHMILDDPYGLYDGLITTLSSALGETGLAMLERELVARRECMLADGAASPLYGVPNLSVINARLREVYEQRGDVDGLIETYSAEERRSARVAAFLARRLTDDDRADEALALLDAAPPRSEHHFFGEYDWTSARIDVLEALGSWAEAQELRLSTFPSTPSSAHLKAYVNRLCTAEADAAFTGGRNFLNGEPGDPADALAFLCSWLTFQHAARLVRVQTRDGHYVQRELLVPAARALESELPLLSVALRRALIEDALLLARASRYPHAAQHVRALEALDGRVGSYEAFETHDQFMTRLRLEHPRKQRFWIKVDGDGGRGA